VLNINNFINIFINKFCN